MSKIFKPLCAVLALAFLFGGCSDTRHLKDLLIVEGMGIDASQKGVELTVQTLNITVSNGSETPQGNMTVNTKKSGDTISDSITGLSASLSKRLFFGQNKLIVIGRELAENGIESNLDYFMRSSNSRSDIAVCVSASDAADIIESKENDASVPCENILYLINTNEKAGLSTLVTTDRLLNLYKDKTSDIYLPVLEKKEKEENVSTAGIGLFSSDRLVYITDREETAGFVIICGKAENVTVEATDGQLGNISVSLSDVRCRKTARLENDVVVFNASVRADMIIEEIENGTSQTLSRQDTQRICAAVQKEVLSLCESAFYACRDNGSDALRVGEQLACDDAAAYSRLSEDWDNVFSSGIINVSADIRLKKISDNTQID